VVFLIGCDHRAAQTYPESSDLDNPQNRIQREFRLLLIRAIEKHHPSLIAEEYHPEFLKRLRQNSVAVEVASEVNITHRFCDPSLENRKRLGISDGPPSAPPGWDNPEKRMQEYFLSEWPIREEFWISQLGKDIHKNVFFVLGAGHRETLRRRLERRAIEVKILEKRFGVSNLWVGDFPAYRAAYRELRRNGFPPIP
jgi:hypothetical protein